MMLSLRVSRAVMAAVQERARSAGLGVSAWVRGTLDRGLGEDARAEAVVPEGRAVPVPDPPSVVDLGPSPEPARPVRAFTRCAGHRRRRCPVCG